MDAQSIFAAITRQAASPTVRSANAPRCFRQAREPHRASTALISNSRDPERIGRGTILKKSDLVTGVTTAATLWVMTVIGLCLGGGQLALGITAIRRAQVLAIGVQPA